MDLFRAMPPRVAQPWNWFLAVRFADFEKFLTNTQRMFQAKAKNFDCEVWGQDKGKGNGKDKTGKDDDNAWFFAPFALCFFVFAPMLEQCASAGVSGWNLCKCSPRSCATMLFSSFWKGFWEFLASSDSGPQVLRFSPTPFPSLGALSVGARVLARTAAATFVFANGVLMVPN